MEMENETQIDAARPKVEKIFFLVFILFVVGSIGITYWKIIIKRDYVVVAQADCDPYEEKCFVHICDPSPDVDGECAGNPEEDIWYTKNISRMAYNVPECDPNDDICTALVCAEGEADCDYELCDETNVPEGDSCNDPEQYAKDNPIEKDETECDPEADESCINEEDELADPCDSAESDVCPLGAGENQVE